MVEKMSSAGKEKTLSKINGYYASSFKTDSLLLKKDEKEGEKIFIYSGIALPEMHLEWAGCHLATIAKDGVVLSIEGAQQIGKTAGKNVVEITRKDAQDLMEGLDLSYDGPERGYVVLKLSGTPICVCKAEEGRIVNTIPQSRRTIRYRKKEENAED